MAFVCVDPLSHPDALLHSRRAQHIAFSWPLLQSSLSRLNRRASFSVSVPHGLEPEAGHSSQSARVSFCPRLVRLQSTIMHSNFHRQSPSPLLHIHPSFAVSVPRVIIKLARDSYTQPPTLFLEWGCTGVSICFLFKVFNTLYHAFHSTLDFEKTPPIAADSHPFWGSSRPPRPEPHHHSQLGHASNPLPPQYDTITYGLPFTAERLDALAQLDEDTRSMALLNFKQVCLCVHFTARIDYFISFSASCSIVRRIRDTLQSHFLPVDNLRLCLPLALLGPFYSPIEPSTNSTSSNVFGKQARFYPIGPSGRWASA